jgi:type IV pilus assembly protein PilB
MPVSVQQLQKTLVESGLVSLEDFERARQEAVKRQERLETILVEKNLVPDLYLGQLIADALGVPYARLDQKKIPDHVLRLVPERLARRARIVAYGKDDDGRLQVATPDPGNLEVLHLIEKRTGLRVAPHYATDVGVSTVIENYSRDLESSIKEVFDLAGMLDIAGSQAAEIAAKAEEGTVVRVVGILVNYAYRHNASDIHVEPRENEVVVRYRIDGILHDVAKLPRPIMEAIIARVKVIAKMRTDQHFVAQDGKFQEVIEGERVDVRVSAIPVFEGEKIVMRLLTERGKQFDLEDIGFSEGDIKKIKRQIQRTYGMFLSTGPTGSGKTTTLYAALKKLNTRDINIATIEDPIEYSIDGVSQIQVNPRAGLTFATGLRSIVRQDPDIIMVGEIRDEETAGIAVNAALTGHLVLSSIHTNDAATTLPRLRDMRIEPFLIASTVDTIIAQRLVRRICPRCIASHEVTFEEAAERLPPEVLGKVFGAGKDQKRRLTLYRGKGCDRCGFTGYRGRVGIFEVLVVDDQIKGLIMAGANAGEVNRAAVAGGMTTMLDDGIRKVLAAVTSLEELLKVMGY